MAITVAELQAVFKGDTSDIDKSFSKIDSEAEKSEGKLRGLAGGVSDFLKTTVVFGAGYKLIQGFSSALDFGKNALFGFNTELQNAGIGFTTMLGSGQKAQQFLNQLKDFAKSTPFDFQGLIGDSQMLLGMGIAAKDVVPDLKALGDSTASVGGNADELNRTILAFAQTSAKGTLSMDNMNQLLQGGVPNALKILAAQFGVSTGKMVEMISAGDVASDQALP
jgi:tape measure domain-containing protein